MQLDEFGGDWNDIKAVRSSNSSVAFVRPNWLKHEDYLVVAKSLGSAAITVSYESYEPDYWDEHGDYVPDRFVRHTVTVKVNVTGFHNLAVDSCDDLFKGRKYSFNKLMEYTAFYENMSWIKGNGRFVKSKGYKTYNNGSKIKFTKSGKVNVKYKVKGKTYTIKVAKVHTISGFKSATKAALKRHLWYDGSLKIKSFKVRTGEKGWVYARVKFRYRSIYGHYNTKSMDAWYELGKVKTDWD